VRWASRLRTLGSYPRLSSRRGREIGRVRSAHKRVALTKRLGGRVTEACSAVGSGAGVVAAVRLGIGPRIADRRTLSFCGRLAWSRFRVVVAGM
jgi:hypothetical protein